ncbi:putative nucleic acid-binding protein [Streptomyces sp. CZ24]|uniref:DNA-binding protein n=1 Tax=Streptomyces TaxID=1883 RepID=UPI00189F5657|nr:MULTISPECIES: DNA-binding protein [Streptomyces]MBV1957968.1 DNA-binding protein [Streptomyces sp. BV333]MCK2143411.1 DNA-binding protein [Streptomyces sp. WAC00276]MCR0986508.1 DNA-binding protein [Streptomyces albidoflavus]MDH6191251.1 putative nucleic acid-binding protein [Streptomyces sp. CZ24]
MAGTLLLDSEGLSKLYRKDPTVLGFIQAARQESVRVATSTMTVVQAGHERVHPARISWTLSRIDVHDVTREVADQATRLLRTHRLHGHKYAIDAVLAALAQSAALPATLLTSDPEDLSLLSGPAVEVVKV